MATKHKYVSQETSSWTFGAELEIVDWPRNEPLPVQGMAVDEAELHNVNSNGVAVDGRGELYHLGGEVLTVPSVSPDGPAEQYDQIKNHWPQATVNYRSGLNVHVRVPGLRDDLGKLIRVQNFCSRVLPALLPVIDPIPAVPKGSPSGSAANFRKRKRDHHTVIPSWRLAVQRRAATPREFFEAEVTSRDGTSLGWAIVPRNAVNLRQLLQTDTVEFRHFFMPASADELRNAALWCKFFLEAALEDDGTTDAEQLLTAFGFRKPRLPWPAPLPYDPWLDTGWHYTSKHHHDGETVKRHIKDWLSKHPGGKPCPT